MKVVILTGERGCGKTTVCAQAARLAQAKALAVRGILTVPRYEAGQLTGLDVQDVPTGVIYPLAELHKATDGPTMGRFHFHADGIRRGRAILNSVTRCDVLVIDELGPLELVEGQGWRDAIDVLNAGICRLGLVVVRPGLVSCLIERLRVGRVFVMTVTVANRDRVAEQLIGLL